MRLWRRSGPATALAAALFLAACANAGVAPNGAAAPAVEAAAAVPPIAKRDGRATVRGQAIAYRAEASEMVMRNAAGAPRATIFSVAYLADAGDPATRPVAFLFNGGPGGATIALREGLSPRMTVAGAAAGSFRFIDNPDSLIDTTDLVFVDAPGTGYGRFFGEGASAEYWGVSEDADAVADFIARWLAEHGRRASPLFLVGESYAGVRVGLVTARLADRAEPLRVRGVALVSPSTSAGRSSGPANADEAAILALPSQAAAAQFHGRGAYVDQPVDVLAEKALAFGRGEYAAALAKGETLDPEERTRVAQTLSDYLGLPAQGLVESNLRLGRDAFVLGLLADRRERIGGSDARAHAPTALTETRQPPYNDPSTSPYTLTYDQTEAVEALFRREIGYAPVEPYIRLSIEANRAWNWSVPGGPISIPALFRDLMARDPDLEVTLMTGYYDLTIPYMRPVSEYLAANLPSDRFENRVFPAGHAVFSDPVGRKASTDHLRAFIGRAVR